MRVAARWKFHEESVPLATSPLSKHNKHQKDKITDIHQPNQQKHLSTYTQISAVENWIITRITPHLLLTVITWNNSTMSRTTSVL